MNWSQLQTILWLRWRLTRNLWARNGGLGAALAFLIAMVGFIIGVATFTAGFIAGFHWLSQAQPQLLMGVWFGITVAFLFFWLIGLLTELQRSETIDLQRLLHLPVALNQIFAINYLASHLALSIVISVPAMIGLSLGLAISRSLWMLLLIPLALSVVFMTTAWTYYLRGWIGSLMTNPRRRRAVIGGITLGFILISQGPNLYLNVFRRSSSRPPSTATPQEVQAHRSTRRAAEQETLRKLITAQNYIPPLWLPMGAQALAENRLLPSVWATLACCGIGVLGLYRAYGTTLRAYRGENKTRRKLLPVEFIRQDQAVPNTRGGWMEARLPWVPEPVSALAFATLRSMLRAPEVKMALATSFLITLILGASIFLRSAPRMPDTVKPFVVTGSAAFSLFMLVQFLANQFGFDRDGFRALVLSPVDRRWILLGKNLAVLPVGAGFGLVLILGMSVWLKLSLATICAAVLQMFTMLVLALLVGNLISMLTPYRIAAGSMKPSKMPALAMITMVLYQMLFPLALAPTFLPALAELLLRRMGMSDQIPFNLLLSLFLAAAAAFAYARLLGPLGRLLHQREMKIL